ncbi:serine hydrolase [Lacinutrix jangbogonensis]|uniref:serine hydrolase n=1 Tax=Lacinutrix jangbogonensis TaxID=1469557 RepID=UPI00053EA8BB|nr:serine hydrolase [Lacinutrix jangbogonensis]
MKKSIFIALALLFNFQVKAQDSKISTEVKEYIQSRVDNQMNVGIVVGYINGDTIEYYSLGKTAMENGVAVNEASVFEIGSISKTFTATLLALKVNSGEMNLDDPISKYLPKAVKGPTRNGKEITLKHLATHTSGLPKLPDNLESRNPKNPYVDYTYKDLYNYISNHELKVDIGSVSEYSNVGMGLLGHILELQSGKTYEELVIEYIANPLQMNDTRLVFNEAMKNRLAKGHEGLLETENWDIITLGGAGGIRSTASDMVKYIQANINSESIDSKLHNAMSLAHKSAYKNEEQRTEMALAWHIENGKFLLHNGATGGYSAMIALEKSGKRGVIVLTNSNQSIDPIGIKIMMPTYPLKPILPSIAKVLEKEIIDNGVEKAIVFYKSIKTEKPNDYNFQVEELNALGYKFLAEGKKEIALALFKLNVAEFPNESNPYDSLGEAYFEIRNQELAVKNYKKSLELNPGNDNARDFLKRLNVEVKEVVVSKEMLLSYTGKYELAPTFKIVITTKEGRLFAQATGQPQFELFPSDYNKFYLKVVEARVQFYANDKGNIESMTLFQNGEVIPGKKVE